MIKTTKSPFSHPRSIFIIFPRLFPCRAYSTRANKSNVALIVLSAICNFLLAGHGNLTVQTPSIRIRKEKTHSNECVFLLETGIYISSPRFVSASHFALLLVIRKSNIIQAQSCIHQNAVKKSNVFQNIFLMPSLSVECSFLQIFTFFTNNRFFFLDAYLP